MIAFSELWKALVQFLAPKWVPKIDEHGSHIPREYHFCYLREKMKLTDETNSKSHF